MNILKKIIALTTFLIFLLSYSSYAFDYKNSVIKSWYANDSILIFKSESKEVITFDSNRNPVSQIKETTNYHIINFDKNIITLVFKDEGESAWSNQSFKYDSTKESSETIVFDTRSDVSQKVHLYINPFTAIAYTYTSGIIFGFDNLETVKNEDFKKLKIYEFKD